MMHVIFVCTGNTCRSPMAKHIAEHLIRGVVFNSAGIFAAEGDPMADFAKKVLEDKEYKVGPCTAKRVNAELLGQADLVLTMTTEQKEIIKSFFEQYREKVYTLKEFNGAPQGYHDISDPFGSSLEKYNLTALDLSDEISKLRQTLMQKYGIE